MEDVLIDGQAPFDWSIGLQLTGNNILSNPLSNNPELGTALKGGAIRVELEQLLTLSATEANNLFIEPDRFLSQSLEVSTLITDNKTTGQGTSTYTQIDRLTGQPNSDIGLTQLGDLAFNSIGSHGINSQVISNASLQATDPNGTFNTATNAGILTTSLNLSGDIGQNTSNGRDQHDFWKFSVTSDLKVNLSLSNLNANAGLALYNSAGQLLTYSNKGGTASESISRWLGKGDYYALVYSYEGWGGSTSYSLGIQASTQLSSLIDDYSVRSAVSSRIGDGILDRNDTIHILRSTKDFGKVDSWEVNDLREIVKEANAFGIADPVRVLANKVVNGNVANNTYQGTALGNLYAGSSDTQMEKLVDKWFFGGDRPVIGNANYTYQSASGSLFQNGISYLDVYQGDLGDCYFLASLGAAARQKPGYIQDMFIDNGDNTFTVRFFKNGVADYVTVDRYLPTDSSGYFTYANNSNGKLYNDSTNELWVALAEKAYAQLNESGWIGQDGKNSYKGIESGWPKNAMKHITGLNTDQTGIVKTFLGIPIGDRIGDIINAYNAGKMVALNTKEGDGKKTFLDPDSKVVADHAYVVTGYYSSTGQFQLYNPWGGSGSTIYLAHSQIKAYFHNWDYTTT